VLALLKLMPALLLLLLLLGMFYQAVKRRQPDCLRMHELMPAPLPLLPLLSHQAVKRRLPLSVETCPHYLLFSAEQIADGDTKFKCAPPLRDEQNRWA
jgi:hypothetical protein